MCCYFLQTELQLSNLSEPVRAAPYSLITLIYSSGSLRSGLTVDMIISSLRERFPLHKHMVNHSEYYAAGSGFWIWTVLNANSNLKLKASKRLVWTLQLILFCDP